MAATGVDKATTANLPMPSILNENPQFQKRPLQIAMATSRIDSCEDESGYEAQATASAKLSGKNIPILNLCLTCVT